MWRAIVGGEIKSAPSISDGLLYFTSQDGKLYCAKIKHQAVIWSYDSKAQIETSPLIQNNKVIFGNIGGWVTALDAKSGKVLWKYKANEAVYSSPAGINGNIIFGTNDNSLICLDDNGKFIWSTPLDGNITTAPAVAENRIIVTSTDGKVTSIK